MNRQKITGITLGVTGGLLCLADGAQAQSPKKNDGNVKPNIIFILTDQQTMSAMGCMGNPHLSTPAMDALAADGVALTRAYCPFPLSGPSRASIMTGRMAFEVGVTDNEQKTTPGALDRNIGFRMREAGYETLYAGKWHIPEINIPDGMGFTRVCGMGDPALPDLCEPYLAKKYDRPVFLVASFLNPHEICEYAREETLPYGPLDAFQTADAPNLPPNFMPSTYEAEAIRLHHAAVPKIHDTYTYTQDDWRRYLYAYYRLVERVDRQVGRLVEMLKKNGLYDDSLIIFTSDHGDGAAAHQWNQKWVLFEEVVNVPLIVKAPRGRGATGVVNDSALSNIGLDIYATICDYGGAALDTAVYKGKSYRDVVEGRSPTLHGEVFIETTLQGIETRAWSLVEGKYKYVLYNFFRNREQLYDLENDRGEMVNLAVDKRYAPELERMRARMYRWGTHTADPRLIRTLKPLVEPREVK